MPVPRTCIPVPKIENDSYDWYERHEWLLKQTKSQQYKVVFIGDSITHFWAGWQQVDHGSAVWNEFYAGKPVANLGYGFDRTQNVLWRLEHGELEGQSPKLAVLCIGTNQFSRTDNYNGDTPENAFSGICAVTDKLRSMFPEMQLAVMNLFPRGWQDPYFHENITAVNALLKKKFSGRESEGIYHVDLTDKYLLADGTQDPECFQPDFCHLAFKGYRIWASAIQDLVNEAVK